jgi:hypothetical protein
MATHSFAARSSDEWAQSVSFQHEFPASAAICELSLTSVNETDDQAGTTAGFLSYTHLEADAHPHDVPINFGDRRAVVGHDQMIRVEWYLRIYSADSKGLLNIFFWDHVT